MMRIIVLNMLFFSSLCCVNAQKKNNLKSTNFSSVQIDTLFEDKISIRAIVLDDGNIWYAGDKNRFVYYDLKSNEKFMQIKISHADMVYSGSSGPASMGNFLCLACGNADSRNYFDERFFPFFEDFSI